MRVSFFTTILPVQNMQHFFCVATSSSVESVNTFAASTGSFYADFGHVSVVFGKLLCAVMSHVCKGYVGTLYFHSLLGCTSIAFYVDAG